MKSISFKNHPVHNLFSTILLLGGGLFAAAGLTSCENFLNGEDVKKQIEEEIAYNNAKEISVLVQAQEGTGSTVPSGNYTAKQGYFFDISFSENPAYSFLEWVAVSKDNPEQIITEGVTFENAASAVTKVKISNDSVAIRLIPKSEERIAISGEPSPRYDPLGVSRDRSITVSFTKEVSEDSFIFEASEIPEGAQTKRDSNGRIWAYIYENQTHLKNVSITNIDDYSIAEHFTCPVVSGKLLTIGVDRGNPIEFNSGEVYKTIKVTLSGEICSKSGVKMNSEKIWNYQITESTDEKATVTLSCTANEGFVYLAGTKDYSLGQKITLSFTEDADYQFVKWDYDSSIIYIAEPNSLNTVATVHEKTTEDNPTQIRAVCVPRLRVTSFAPVNTATTPTVSKNSSIVITFNKNLPTAAEDLAQLQNISIAMGGSPVKSSFSAPVINENTITFAADNTNMLNVPSGQTKTVSVTIPSGFYYKLDNGTKVTYGGNGKTFDYKIDETTIDKAEVTFTATSNSGIIKSDTGTKQYSIGQEVALSFEAAEGWKFNGWNITAGGTAVSENKIKIANKSAPVTQFTVYEAIQGVTISANASQKFKVSSVTPTASVNPKDSSITITFNKNLASECSSLLNTIRVSVDGSSVDSNYSRAISTNKITLTNTKYLSVADGLQKTVTVTVPSTFYYKDGSVDVPLENDYSFTFVVNSESTSKANITHAVTANAGTITPTAGLVNYSLDKEIPLTFTPAAGYEFTGWTVTTSSGSAVDNSKISIDDASKLSTKLRIYQSVSNVTVKANAYLVPTATTSPEYNGNGVDCDTAITITFNKAIATSADVTLASNGVIQIVNASNEYEHYESHFNTPSWSSDKKTLTIRPKNTIRNIFASPTDLKNLRVKVDYSKIKDSESHAVKVTGDSFWTYRIKYDMEKIAPEVTMKLYKPQYNMDQEISGSYTPLSDAETLNSSTYATNHVGARVYFDSTATDTGSGFKQFTIVETLKATVNGTEQSLAGIQSSPVTLATCTKRAYELQSEYDGLVQLDFIFEDYAGNKTTKSWKVIKDTNVDISKLSPSSESSILSGWTNIQKNNTYTNFLEYKNGSAGFNRLKPDANNKVNDKLDFSGCYDKYYNYATSPKLNFKLYYGYSKDTITNEVTSNSSKICNFTRDADKDCFIKIIGWDDVGNMKSVERVIPRQVSIISTKQKTDSSGYKQELLQTKNFDILESLKTTYGFDVVRLYCFYIYKANESSSPSNLVRFEMTAKADSVIFPLAKTNLADDVLTPDGIYYLYLMPCFVYADREYFGAASEPYVYYHNVSSGYTETTPSLPSSFTTTVLPAEKSTGQRTVKITLPSGFTKTSGFTYGVTYNRSGTTNYNDLEQFTVPSGLIYNFKIYARNNKTNKIYISTYSKDVDLKEDNVPPALFSNTPEYSRVSRPDTLSFTGWELDSIYGIIPVDSGSGIFKNNGLCEFDYYIKKVDTETAKFEPITKEEFSGLTKHTVSYPEGAKIIKMDWDSFVESCYVLAIDVKDTKENEAVYSMLASNKVLPRFPQMNKISYNASSSTDVYCRFNIDQSGVNYFKGIYKLLNVDWQSEPVWYGSCDLRYNALDIKTPDNSGNSGKGFFRVIEKNTYLYNGSGVKTDVSLAYTLYYYFCLDYQLRLEQNPNLELTNKSVIPGLGGNSYQVFYDAPCFAHTMAFPTELLADLDSKTTAVLNNYSSMDREAAYAAVWETKGREYGLKLLNEAWEQGTATYTAPVNKIPAGFSYVTVFHFADGTTVMSEVKQK